MIAGSDGKYREALESVGSDAVCPDAGSDDERVMRIAGGLFRLTPRDRNPARVVSSSDT